MDGSDALLLARAQFGLNIAFHILFSTLTIGLAWILVYFRAQYARTGEAAWLSSFRLWTKVFALTFAMGVVSLPDRGRSFEIWLHRKRSWNRMPTKSRRQCLKNCTLLV